MTDAYISWEHSSHASQAVCNDCHVLHTSIPRVYAFKVQENCLRCHKDRLAAISACRKQPDTLRYWDCHWDVLHGRVHSLSASPEVFRPKLSPVLSFSPDFSGFRLKNH